MEIIFSTIGFKPKIFKEPSFSFTILFPTNKALRPLESQYLAWDKSIIKFLQPLLLVLGINACATLWKTHIFSSICCTAKGMRSIKSLEMRNYILMI